MPESENTMYIRSNGVGSEGIPDQYADGKAAKVWEIFIGDKKSRTKHYSEFLVEMLRSKGCKRVLDVACGTGVDSTMLVEEGFEVGKSITSINLKALKIIIFILFNLVSCDASDKMLKYALKERWDRRKEPNFDNWGKFKKISLSKKPFCVL